MTKKTLLVWVALLTFGFSSLPVLAFSPESKQTGNTDATGKKKHPRNKHKKHHSKKQVKKHVKKQVKKHKKGSSKYKSGGKKKKYKSVSKKKWSKGKKNGKGKRYGKRKSKRNRSVYTRKSYTPGTNSNNVEYKNYKRNNDANENNNEIEKIAPQKEIRKEPKKDGE